CAAPSRLSESLPITVPRPSLSLPFTSSTTPLTPASGPLSLSAMSAAPLHVVLDVPVARDRRQPPDAMVFPNDTELTPVSTPGTAVIAPPRERAGTHRAGGPPARQDWYARGSTRTLDARASASYEVQNDHDERDSDQDVDECAADMNGEKAQGPQDQQQRSDAQQHDELPVCSPGHRLGDTGLPFSSESKQQAPT